MEDPKGPSIASVDLIGLDGATGKVTSRLPLPTSKSMYPGKTVVREPMMLPMLIEDDGTAALAINTVTNDQILGRVRSDLRLLRVSPSGAAVWQTIREYDDDWASANGYVPGELTQNGEGALLVRWFERDPDFSHALVTRTRVLPWESTVGIDAIDGLGNGYGVAREGHVVRLDVTTGRAIGDPIRAGKNVRALWPRAEGGVAVRDSDGNLRHYDADGALLKTVQTPANGYGPWRFVTAGRDVVETDGLNVVAFRIDDR
jgi:hypothetical protein